MWRLATIQTDEGPAGCLVVEDRIHTLAALAEAAHVTCPRQAVKLFSDWSTYRPLLDQLASRATQVEGQGVEDAPLLAPLRYPGKILCAGANYYDHMAEMGFPDVVKDSQRLFFFMKPPRQAIVGPGDTVVMPRGCEKFDWEAELVAVIGRTARYVSAKDAMACVAGYSIAIDLSARDANMVPDQFYKFDWVAGKANDTCCPLGPWIVPAEAIGDPQDLGIQLSVNGQLKQDGRTSQMIYSVAEQIARASEIMTLEPGDIVLTGTPAGVGVPKGEFLSVGDRIDVAIEKIGAFHVRVCA